MSVEDQETTPGELGKVPSEDVQTAVEKLPSSSISNDGISLKREAKKDKAEPTITNAPQDGGLLIVPAPKSATKRRRSSTNNTRANTTPNVKSEEEVNEVPRPNKRKRKREDSETPPGSPKSKSRSPRPPKLNGIATPTTVTSPVTTTTTTTTSFGPSASSSLIVDPNDPQKTKVMLKLKLNRTAPTQPSKLQNEIKIITSSESSPDPKPSISLPSKPSTPSINAFLSSIDPALSKRQQKQKKAPTPRKASTSTKGNVQAKEEKHSPPPLIFNTSHVSSYSSLVLPEQTAIEIVEFTNLMWKSYPRYLKNWNESDSKTREDTWYRRIHDLVTTANAQVLLSKLPNRGVVDGGVSADGEKERQEVPAST